MGVAIASRRSRSAPAHRSVQAVPFVERRPSQNTGRCSHVAGSLPRHRGLASLGTQPRLLPDALVADIKTDIRKLVPTQANFAFDEIYWAKGPVSVNGTTLVPNDTTDAARAHRREQRDRVRRLQRHDDQHARCEDADGRCRAGGARPDQHPPRRRENQAVAVLRDKLDLDALQKELPDRAKLLLGPFKLAGTSADIKLENDGTATLTAMGTLDILKIPPGESLRVKRR